MFACVSSLQENAIGNEGVIFLAEALKTNKTLHTLWYDRPNKVYNKRRLSASTPKQLKVNRNRNCSHLSLQGVSAGTSGANAMAEALLVNGSLHTLE